MKPSWNFYTSRWCQMKEVCHHSKRIYEMLSIFWCSMGQDEIHIHYSHIFQTSFRKKKVIDETFVNKLAVATFVSLNLTENWKWIHVFFHLKIIKRHKNITKLWKKNIWKLLKGYRIFKFCNNLLSEKKMKEPNSKMKQEMPIGIQLPVNKWCWTRQGNYIEWCYWDAFSTITLPLWLWVFCICQRSVIWYAL